MGIRHASLARLHGQGAKVAVRKSPKRRLPDAHHRYRSHIQFRIARPMDAYASARLGTRRRHLF